MHILATLYNLMIITTKGINHATSSQNAELSSLIATHEPPSIGRKNSATTTCPTDRNSLGQQRSLSHSAETLKSATK